MKRTARTAAVIARLVLQDSSPVLKPKSNVASDDASGAKAKGSRSRSVSKGPPKPAKMAKPTVKESQKQNVPSLLKTKPAPIPDTTSGSNSKAKASRSRSASNGPSKPAKVAKPSVKESQKEKSTPSKKPKGAKAKAETKPKPKAPKKKGKAASTAAGSSSPEGESSPYFPPTSGPSSSAASKSSKSKSISPGSKMGRDFYDQECVPLCKALLGTVLVRRLPGTGQIVRGTIVETEAYAGGDDKASVSYQGRRTPGNEAMFLDPGTAYVYMTYGMYFCFNISCRGEGSAVLLRAVEPLEDYEVMHGLRKPPKKNKDNANSAEEGARKAGKRLNAYELANGPSKICMAFDIRKDSCDKLDMAGSDELWIEPSQEDKYRNRRFEIEVTKRIGIDSAPPESRDRLLRFLIKDNLAVSKAKVGEIKKRLAEAQASGK